MNIVKRMLALLLTAAMLLTVPVFAEEVQLESVKDIEVGSEMDGKESESEWWNILLLGGDSRSLTQYGRTDTMIILSINREESLMKMTSIMRDTWVQLSSGHSEKINAANVFGGPELAVKVVNENFGTDIEHYVLINMNGLVELIDMVGGVTMEVTPSERNYTNKYAQEYLREVAGYNGKTSLGESGLVHLNGLLAVAYLRNRYSDSDFGRVMRQQKVMLAVAEQAQQMEVDELMGLSEDIFERVETNMTADQLKELAMAGLVTEIEDVAQFRVPADGTYESGMYSGTWMIRPNFEKNQALLQDFIYGVEQE